ncbi:hypothetical protein [Streptomyces beijiangensis]|uniref:Uncharacterized protein n=1 Tax=Streptomyces beijiangensis TaxID=163361 RepID=A0A939F5H3_9ACTN|nr:hypothetical protein [Streptomyces beijiangensis]MBO0512263.1 hypothetical protein [Streptomyces beijiangensis]
MTAAGGLALMIIGAILRYAITWEPTWINLSILGTILMIGGAAGLVLGLVLTYTRRRRVERAQQPQQPYDQRYYQDPPPPR